MKLVGKGFLRVVRYSGGEITDLVATSATNFTQTSIVDMMSMYGVTRNGREVIMRKYAHAMVPNVNILRAPNRMSEFVQSPCKQPEYTYAMMTNLDTAQIMLKRVTAYHDRAEVPTYVDLPCWSKTAPVEAPITEMRQI